MRKLSTLTALILVLAACPAEDAKPTDAAGDKAKAGDKDKAKAGDKDKAKAGDKDKAADKDKAGDKAGDKAAADNTAVATAIFKDFSAGNLDAVLANFTDDIELIEPGNPMPAKGKDAVRANWAGFMKAFSDIKAVPVRVIDGGDVVAVQFVSNGTNDGEFMGKPATQKKVGMEELMIAWFDGGKIKKAMFISNSAAMMSQLGMMPDGMPPMEPPALPTADAEVIRGAAEEGLQAAAQDWYSTFSTATAADKMKEIAAEDFVSHDTSMGKTVTGLAENMKSFDEFKAAFPDFKAVSAETFAAGNWTVGTSVGEGTHTGDMGPIKATNKKVTMTYAEVCRFDAGKLKECWGYMNNVEMMAQLGLLPEMPGAPADAPADAPPK